MTFILDEDYWNIYILGSIYDAAINCCKSKGVPRLCQGSCIPGEVAPISRRGIKCGKKYANEMLTCKLGKTILKQVT